MQRLRSCGVEAHAEYAHEVRPRRKASTQGLLGALSRRCLFALCPLVLIVLFFVLCFRYKLLSSIRGSRGHGVYVAALLND
jgi:hypothetical protein